ncbi:MAG: hypothetical protein Q9224_005205, partial [Gallowayella concinna]
MVEPLCLLSSPGCSSLQVRWLTFGFAAVLADYEPPPSMRRPLKSVAKQRRATARQKNERPGGAQDSSTLAEA